MQSIANLYLCLLLINCTIATKILLSKDNWKKVTCNSIPININSTNCPYMISESNLSAKGVNGCKIEFYCNKTKITGTCCNKDEDREIKISNKNDANFISKKINEEVKTYSVVDNLIETKKGISFEGSENANLSYLEIDQSQGNQKTTYLSTEEIEPLLLKEEKIADRLLELGSHYFHFLVATVSIILVLIVMLLCCFLEIFNHGFKLILGRIMTMFHVCFGCKRDIGTQTNQLELDTMEQGTMLVDEKRPESNQTRHINEINSCLSLPLPPPPTRQEMLAITANFDDLANPNTNEQASSVDQSFNNYPLRQTQDLPKFTYKPILHSNPFECYANAQRKNTLHFADTAV